MDPDMFLSIVLQQAGIRLDANETAFFARALEHVKSRDFDVIYANLKATEFVPVNPATPAGAEAIVFRQYDRYGAAKIVSNYADDIPLVDVLGKEYTGPVKSITAGYLYTIQDIRRSVKAGTNLEEKKAQAARDAVRREIDRIIALGDEEHGLVGFINNPNIPETSAITGSWNDGTTTVDQCIADMNALVAAVVDRTDDQMAPDTLLLPTTKYNYIAQTRVPDLSETILSYFQRTNPWIQRVDSWRRLNGAGDTATDRMIAYHRSPVVLQSELPLPLEQLPPQPTNLALKNILHARCGGTTIHYPMACGFMDGI